MTHGGSRAILFEKAAGGEWLEGVCYSILAEPRFAADSLITHKNNARTNI